jgi:hypothetical protein
VIWCPSQEGCAHRTGIGKPLGLAARSEGEPQGTRLQAFWFIDAWRAPRISLRAQENRDKSGRWFRGDVLPSIDEDGRAVLIGNWLHTDGLMARLKNTGIFTVLEFSLLREGDGTEVERCTWKAKYPTQEAINRKRDELGDIGFRREMLLQVVPEEGQDVHPEDIHYYDDPPFDDGNHLAHGVDLAISTKESADFTAIVSGEVTWPAGHIEIYVQPHPIIRRMTFSETMDTLDGVRRSSNMSSEFFVEAVAYRQAAIEEMERRGFSVQAMQSDQGQARPSARCGAVYQDGDREIPADGMRTAFDTVIGLWR